MKLKTCLLAALLAVFVLLLLPNQAQAAEIVKSGTCGENLTWVLDSDGTLTISGTGDMQDFSSHGAPWYAQRKKITSLVIEEGVTGIGDRAFWDCKMMAVVTIPRSITRMGDHSFFNCEGLTDLYIPDLTAWFNIRFTNAEGNPVLHTKNLYVNGQLLTELVIPEGITEIPRVVFSGYEALTSVTIPTGITKIGMGAFTNCTGLTSFAIPKGVTTIEPFAFGGCSNLTSVIIPEGVTTIGKYAFGNCSNIRSLTIPSTLVEIEEGAFDNCNELKTVKYTGTETQWDSILISPTNNEPLLEIEPEFIPRPTTPGSLLWICLLAVGILAFGGAMAVWILRKKIP